MERIRFRLSTTRGVASRGSVARAGDGRSAASRTKIGWVEAPPFIGEVGEFIRSSPRIEIRLPGWEALGPGR